MMPALLSRTCSGPCHSPMNVLTEPWSDRSSRLTDTFELPVCTLISAATFLPDSIERTASVTSAPALAKLRAVSMPIPEDAPVTTTRLPTRSVPPTTSSAVELKPKGVRIKSMSAVPSKTATAYSARKFAPSRSTHDGRDFGEVLYHRTRAPAGKAVGNCQRVEAKARER